MQTDLLISKALVDAIVAYLSDRPYKEVAQGVTALMALQPASRPETPEEPALAGDDLHP